MWTQITVDEELGLVYLPVETPTSDYYGGHRPGDNLFAESLVCVDLKTGQRKWHFQFVHHPLWNFDMTSAPLLGDVTVDGKPRKIVAVPGKQAWLYVFDRVTGEPIWPIVEKPVPKGDVPGEAYSPTQPHPPDELRYARNFFTLPDDLIDFTPELRAQAVERAKKYVWATDTVQPVDPRARRRDVRRDHGRHRNELAGRRLRSGAAHRVRARRKHGRRQDAGRAAAGLFRHQIRLGPRRAAVQGSARARGLLRRRRATHGGARARGQGRARRLPRPASRSPRARRPSPRPRA